MHADHDDNGAASDAQTNASEMNTEFTSLIMLY